MCTRLAAQARGAAAWHRAYGTDTLFQRHAGRGGAAAPRSSAAERLPRGLRPAPRSQSPWLIMHGAEMMHACVPRPGGTGACLTATWRHNQVDESLLLLAPCPVRPPAMHHTLTCEQHSSSFGLRGTSGLKLKAGMLGHAYTAAFKVACVSTTRERTFIPVARGCRRPSHRGPARCCTSHPVPKQCIHEQRICDQFNASCTLQEPPCIGVPAWMVFHAHSRARPSRSACTARRFKRKHHYA